MKNLISFIIESEKSKKDSEKSTIVKSLPLHGKHADPEIKIKRYRNVKKDVSSTPVHAYPTHGQHSGRKNRKFVIEDESISPKRYMEWHDKNDNSHLGNNNEEVQTKLHEHHNTATHTEEIKEYTKHSNPLNRYLIDKSHARHTNESHEFNSKHEDMAENLDKQLRNHSLPHDLNTYHGCGFNPDHFAKQNENRSITLPAFTSTSINKHLATKFSHRISDEYDPDGQHHIIHFHIPTGHPGKYIGKDSQFDNEKEFLLPKDTKWKISEKPEKYIKDGDIHINVWHAHPHQD